jgi:hypothetical protein
MEALTNGVGGAQAAPKTDIGAMVDLTRESLDKAGCYARNESSAYPMPNLFIGDSRLGCKSDADEQLLLHVAFNEVVKVHSIKLTAFNLGLDEEANPTIIKLFVNRENIGFEDCDDIDPTQTLEILAEDLKEDAKPILLKFVKFQRVNSITVYIEENAGAEQTALGGLKFFGRTVGTTNMADLQKQG